MLQQINSSAFAMQNYASLKNKRQLNSQELNERQRVVNYSTNPNQVDSSKMLQALRAQALIPTARTISFGGPIEKNIQELTDKVVTCGTEEVGKQFNLNKLFSKVKNKFGVNKKIVDQDSKDKTYTVEQKGNDRMSFNMTVKNTEGKEQQSINIEHNKMQDLGQRSYVFDNKGSQFAVIEDGEGVLLTRAGRISSKDGNIKVDSKKIGREFKPFAMQAVKPIEYKETESIGEGGEVVIGLQKGRFCKELVQSIKDFEAKVNAGEIQLPQFKAKENAKDMQMTMLAGGYGSRAEYTNASSRGIFHNEKEGPESTKGVFRTVTGLTPMETTLVTLHKAGLVDCSKGKFGIGKNVRFYMNESSKNTGNGGFTLDLYDTMGTSEKKGILILPNDSISRMSKAASEATELVSSGKASVAMIGKKVPWEKTIKTFGIIELGEGNEMKAFAEKPKQKPPESFIDKDGNCLTNTFQFAVSKESIDVLKYLEPKLNTAAKNPESRDWSKQLLPTLMAISQNDDPKMMRSDLARIIDAKPDAFEAKLLDKITDEELLKAKDMLKGQKLYAVPTDEPWVDAGQFDSMYDVSIDIAKGKFALEPFEQAHAQKCVNSKTGLVTNSPELRKEIEGKYNINGEVMAMRQAEQIDEESLFKEFESSIIRHK